MEEKQVAYFLLNKITVNNHTLSLVMEWVQSGDKSERSEVHLFCSLSFLLTGLWEGRKQCWLSGTRVCCRCSVQADVNKLATELASSFQTVAYVSQHHKYNLYQHSDSFLPKRLLQPALHNERSSQEQCFKMSFTSSTVQPSRAG